MANIIFSSSVSDRVVNIRSLNQFLHELTELSFQSNSLVHRPLGPLTGKDGNYHVPRYVYFGDKGGGDGTGSGIASR